MNFPTRRPIGYDQVLVFEEQLPGDLVVPERVWQEFREFDIFPEPDLLDQLWRNRWLRPGPTSKPGRTTRVGTVYSDGDAKFGPEAG